MMKVVTRRNRTQTPLTEEKSLRRVGSGTHDKVYKRLAMLDFSAYKSYLPTRSKTFIPILADMIFQSSEALSKDKKSFYYSTRFIAAELGISHTTVSKTIRLLLKLGLVSIVKEAYFSDKQQKWLAPVYAWSTENYDKLLQLFSDPDSSSYTDFWQLDIVPTVVEEVDDIAELTIAELAIPEPEPAITKKVYTPSEQPKWLHPDVRLFLVYLERFTHLILYILLIKLSSIYSILIKDVNICNLWWCKQMGKSAETFSPVNQNRLILNNSP